MDIDGPQSEMRDVIRSMWTPKSSGTAQRRSCAVSFSTCGVFLLAVLYVSICHIWVSSALTQKIWNLDAASTWSSSILIAMLPYILTIHCIPETVRRELEAPLLRKITNHLTANGLSLAGTFMECRLEDRLMQISDILAPKLAAFAAKNPD